MKGPYKSIWNENEINVTQDLCLVAILKYGDFDIDWGSYCVKRIFQILDAILWGAGGETGSKYVQRQEVCS